MTDTTGNPLLDAWSTPFGLPPFERIRPEHFRAAFEAAEVGRDATIPWVARKGRASYLGERSAGHLDPGATSTALLFRALAETLA